MSALSIALDVPEKELEKYSHVTQKIESKDDILLNVNIWLSNNPVATLFYIHGIQSHSGWLFETGPFLAGMGINVIAMDRRGSGASEGSRGHCDNADFILNDYRIAWEYAVNMSEGLPLVAFGQSFGGSVLAALMCRFNLPVEKLIFSAPALGQQRLKYGTYDLNARRATKGLEQIVLGLRDAEYSTDEKYLRFIANDAFVNRRITKSMASSMVELEDIYFDNKNCMERIACPVHFIEPLSDSIIDINQSFDVMNKYVNLQRHVIDIHSHYMEFSNKRHELWKLISNLCIGKVS